MGLIDGTGVLLPLHKQLETDLEGIGFEPEGRVFQPHLTLGRVIQAGKEELIRRMERYREEEFANIGVERVILFKSDLRPTGQSTHL